jgi:hypothetical protein
VALELEVVRQSRSGGMSDESNDGEKLEVASLIRLVVRSVGSLVSRCEDGVEDRLGSKHLERHQQLMMC